MESAGRPNPRESRRTVINTDKLIVRAWVDVRAGCDITYKVHDSEGVYVTLDGESEPFELFFDIKALRDFLVRGGEALAEMEALAAEEDG